MQSFALFRLPYAQEMTLIAGEVAELPSCTALSNQQGFVVAPFAPSESLPILLIRPEKIERLASLSHLAGIADTAGISGFCRFPGLSSLSISSHKELRQDYRIDFNNFHAQLLEGRFQKLVLSRSLDIERTEDASPLDLFQRACERYPRVMVSLAYTPQSGLWLTATPEILLSGCGSQWQTVALAGTMPFNDDLRWNDKNIQEQRYVATYIAQRLEHFTDDFREDGPSTIRAGHLAHLRSDFHFTLSDNTRVGELLHALHPTPAVCGLPKEAAFRFIQQNEHAPRSYYTGFMGPLFVEGRTDLFVTLRCMQVFQNGYRLYAGGGLLKDSNEEQEWQETETKLDTMRKIVKS